MAKGREKSDGRVVPKGRRKMVSTGAGRGGKAPTASKQADQLSMVRETAEYPQGADDGAEVDRSTSAPRAVPKSRSIEARVLPAMTIEEVANEQNHIRRRLRAIVLRHWRRRGNKALRFSRYGWKQSISKRAHGVLPNAYFAGRGLISLEKEWQRREAKRRIASAWVRST